MSELISKKKLIESIKKFDFGSFFSATEKEYIESTMIAIVNLQQTAYDIGKVIEELEKKKGKYFDGITCEGTKIKINEAIEIVKQGVVSDDVCECRLLKGYKVLYKTSCCNVFEMENGFKFCPYCGNKIKVVE